MQPIERYGVIALVFFLVTIAAVVIWGPGSEETSAGDGTMAKQDGAAARTWRKGDLPAGRSQAAAEGRQRAFQPALPLHEPAPRTEPRPPLAAQSTPSPDAPRAGAGSTAASDRALPLGFPPEYGSPSPALRERLAERDAQLRAARERSAGPAEPRPTAGAAAASTVSAAGSGGARVYVVRPGDTLSEIALAELGSSKRWKEIQAQNGGLDPAKLYEGMKLKLPAAGERPAAPATAAAAPAAGRAPAGTPVHVVESGDSLWKIAESRLGDGLRWKEIEKLNPGLPSVLHVGLELRLPADAIGGAAAPRRAPASELVAASAPAAAEKRRVR